MNMQSIMAQAQRMSKDIQKKQEEINKMEFEGKSAGFKVVLNGKREVISAEINREMIKDPEDLDALEDMIKIALNEANNAIAAETKKKLGAFSNGLSGLL